MRGRLLVSPHLPSSSQSNQNDSSGARFYQITLLYMNTLLEQAASRALKPAGSQAVQNYLQSITGDAAALANAAAVPQAIGNPFSYYSEDLRPVQTHKADGSRDEGSWAAAAPFEAALIYYMIFSFHLTIWHFAARGKAGWHKKTTFWTLYSQSDCSFALSS